MEKKRNNNPSPLVFIIAALLFLSSCSVKTEPEKIWNIRGKIVALAESLKGIPYHYGGSDIDGFDCSGFVFYLYDSFGVRIPRTAKMQGEVKSKTRFRKALPGDILVFRLGKRKWHSGIYINKKYFIHSPNESGSVRREYFSDFWIKKLKSVISVLDRD